MPQSQTQAVMIPPPPEPPAGRVAAAMPDPDCGPRRNTSSGFRRDVLNDLRRMVWPADGGVWASTAATVGILGLLTLLLWGASAAAKAVSVVIGVR